MVSTDWLCPTIRKLAVLVKNHKSRRDGNFVKENTTENDTKRPIWFDWKFLQTCFIVFYYIYQIYTKIFCKLKKLSYMNESMYNLIKDAGLRSMRVKYKEKNS